MRNTKKSEENEPVKCGKKTNLFKTQFCAYQFFRGGGGGGEGGEREGGGRGGGEGEGVSTTIRVQNNLPFSEDSSNNSHSVPLFCIGKQDSSTRSLQAAV